MSGQVRALFEQALKDGFPEVRQDVSASDYLLPFGARSAGLAELQVKVVKGNAKYGWDPGATASGLVRRCWREGYAG